MLEQYPDLLTVKDLQSILGVARGLVYELLQTEQISAIRVGQRKWRITKSAVIAYLKNV